MRNRYQTIAKLFFVGLALVATRAAVAEVIDTTVSWVNRGGSTSTSVVAPANISFFDAYQNAAVQVTGGTVNWLTLHDNSTASISGGDVSWLQLGDSSSVRITGINSLSWLVFSGSTSHAEIVASNVQYTSGHLSGNWANGKPFEFWAITDPMAPNYTMPSNILITAVPEPVEAVMLLGGLVLLAVRRKNVPHKSDR